MDEALRRVLAVLGTQAGTLHVRQAIAEGISQRRVNARIAAGGWVEGPPGVVRIAGSPDTWDQRVWRWYLAARDGPRTRPHDVALAGLTAARSLGWELQREQENAPLEFVFRIGPRAPVADEKTARFTRVGDWPQRRFATVRGWQVTHPIDTCVDLARPLSREELFGFVQAELFRRPAGRERLLERCRQGVAGAETVRSIAAAIDSGIDSVFHEQGHGLLREIGVPRPVCGQVIVEGTGEIDCLIKRPKATCPPWGLIVQWDGLVHRTVAAKRRHDRVRDRKALGSGYYMEHVEYEEMKARSALGERLTAAWDMVVKGVWPPPLPE